MTLSAGTRLGPYEVVELVGAGGMGAVYRARDPRLGRDVAIKVLPDDIATDRDRLRRFEQEARAVAALNHPNILSVYDVGTQPADEGSGAAVTSAAMPYVVTELLEGENLREVSVAAQPDTAPGPRLGRADGAGPRRRAPQGDRPPRPQAGEPVPHHGGAGEDPRLRPGEAHVGGGGQRGGDGVPPDEARAC